VSVVNAPNLLTLYRILSVPAIVIILLTRFEGWEIVGFVVFVLAAITDAVDGYWARKKKLVTVVGQLLDPTADKLLIASALICLVQIGRVPAWMAVVIIGRELAVSGFRAIASSRGLTIPASALGKAKMGMESWTIAALILGPYILGKLYIVARVGLWIVFFIAVVSAAEYYLKFGPQIISKES
jgi:CDP-diacylglycerol--glycerol-3-phosphate 3-phosphatidyltransferase